MLVVKTAMRTMIAALALAGAVSCSSAAEQDSAPAPVSNQVTVTGRAYSPQTLTVNVGDTVTWVFDDGGMTHDVVADDKSFRSRLMVSGSFTHTFDTPGTYSYHCTPHPDMQASIVVR